MSILPSSEIKDIGTVLTPDLFKRTDSLFSSVALRVDPEKCEVTRDLSYGIDTRHKLDVFRPKQNLSTLPVIVFVHGGGFVQGDKGGENDLFYNNVGAWSVENNFIGVNITYRLAPDAKWPAGSEDISLAIDWIVKNIQQFNGDPRKIFIMGHSAGAVHVAGYIANLAEEESVGKNVVGAMMLSGIYNLVSLEHSQFEEAYFGKDVRRFSKMSTLSALVSTELPLFFSVAEFDPPSFQQQAKELVNAYFDSHKSYPRLAFSMGQNHISEIYQLGCQWDNLGEQIVSFISQTLNS